MKRIDETVLNDILEGRTARKTNEKMGNKEGGTNATLDGKPEDESEVEGEAELDAEDTMEAVSKDAVMSPEMKAIQAIADKKKKDSRKDDDIEEEGEMTRWKRDLEKKHPGAWAKAWKDADDPKKVAAAKKKVAAADKRDAAEYAALHRDDEGKIDASKKNEKSSAEGPKIGPKTPAEDTQDRIRKTRRMRRWSGKYDNEPRQNNLPFPPSLRQKKDMHTMPSQATLDKPEPGRDAFEKSEKEDADEMSDPGKIDASKKNGDWIKKAVNPKNKGACTPMTKGTCTPARKALAKRFKKAGRKEKKEGGTGWQGKV
jgi:hypothetical protein